MSIRQNLEVVENDNITLLLKDVIISGIQPAGTINITENGNYDVKEYASAAVNVPQPSGKITITENGTGIDIAHYATADVNVPGIVPTGTINITENGNYDVKEYASAAVNVPTHPGNVIFKEITLSADTATFTDTFDKDKTLYEINLYFNSFGNVPANSMLQAIKLFSSNDASSSGIASYLAGNGSFGVTYSANIVGIDTDTGTITFTARSGQYFRAGTYYLILIYAA